MIRMLKKYTTKVSTGGYWAGERATRRQAEHLLFDDFDLVLVVVVHEISEDRSNVFFIFVFFDERHVQIVSHVQILHSGL